MLSTSSISSRLIYCLKNFLVILFTQPLMACFYFSFQAKYDALNSDSKKTILPLTKASLIDDTSYKYYKLNPVIGSNGYFANGIYKGSHGSNGIYKESQGSNLVWFVKWPSFSSKCSFFWMFSKQNTVLAFVKTKIERRQRVNHPFKNKKWLCINDLVSFVTEHLICSPVCQQ